MAEMQDLLQQTILSHASDLHISAGSPVMMRIHGSVKKIDKKPITKEAAHNLVSQILTKEQTSILADDHEIDFSFTLPQGGRFRVNVFYQRQGWVRCSGLSLQNYPPWVTLVCQKSFKNWSGLMTV